MLPCKKNVGNLKTYKMNIDDINKIFFILDKGGVIVVLCTILYYGKRFVEKIIENHNKHIIEIIDEYKKIQRETNEVNKEIIRVMARHNDLIPHIQEIYQIIKYERAV